MRLHDNRHQPMFLKIATVAAAMLIASPASTALSVTEAARAIQPGELVLLTIRSTEAIAGLHVTAFGHAIEPFRIDPHAWRVLVGIDLDVRPGVYDVAIDAATSAGDTRTTHPLHVVDRTFPTRRLRVAEAYVNPPPETARRIEEEAARLARLWTASSPTRLWTPPFVRPVPQRANSAFGTRSIFNGQPRSPHSGADFPSPKGTRVLAPAAGRVVLADDLYYTGNTVVIDHGLGLFSLFAHLSRTDVREGEMVKRGAELGLVGATGRVTGPHLHWTVRASGARIDPLSLLALLG